MAQAIVSQKVIEDKTSLGQVYGFSSVVSDLVQLKVDGHVVATMTLSDFSEFVSNAENFKASVIPPVYTASMNTNTFTGTTSATNEVVTNG